VLPMDIEFAWPNTLIEIIVTIAVAVVTRFVVRRLINQFIKHAGQRQAERAGHDITTDGINTNRATQRAKTLGTVLKSITDVILIVVVVLMVLNSININVMPAIASAGVVGIAVAFGAQSLVKDFFNGICMIMEDQYGVGDIVKIDDIKGTVRAVGFRITEVQDINGQVWYLRNGEITTVGNISQGFSKSIIDIPVSVEENPGAVIKLLRRTCARMDAEPDWHNQMLEAPNVLGLSSLDESAAIYQILISCPADRQWSVEREIRSRVLTALRRAGMHTPRRAVVAVPSRKPEEPTSALAQKRRPLSKAARDHRTGQDAEPGSTGDLTAAAAADKAPALSEETPAPGQQITAREWLEDSAGRNVRWVSASDTGHNMAAEETIAMDSTAIAKKPSGRRRRFRRPGAAGTDAQAPSDATEDASAQGASSAQVLSADTTHQLPKVD